MGNDLKRWRDIPDDFVVPVPEVARILDVSEEAIYSGVLGGYYVLLAPNDRWLSFVVTIDLKGHPILYDPVTVLQARGHWVHRGDELADGEWDEVSPPWSDVGRHELLQWLRDGTVPAEFSIYDEAPSKVNGHSPISRWLFSKEESPPPRKPSFLGVSGALLKRFLNEGFPPPADSPKVQEIEPPAREDARETMRAIVAGLLEEAGAAFLIERPTEAEASKASALLEAIERRRGKTIAPKTLSRYLRNWLRAED